MSVPILVSKKPSSAAFWLCFTMAMIFIIPAFITIGREPVTSITLFIISGFFGSIALFARWMSRRGRRTIRITEDGFEWVERRTLYPDADFAGIAGICTPYYHKGEYQGRQLDATLHYWSNDRLTEFPILYRQPKSELNFLYPLLARLESTRLKEVRADLANGGTLTGAEWTLSAKDLRSRSGDSEVVVPLVNIAAVNQFNDHLFVWERGQEDPFLRIPLREKDAHVLVRYLVEDVIPPNQPWSEDDGSLGPRCFERNLTLTPLKFLGLIVLSILGLLSGPAVVVGGVLGMQPKLAVLGFFMMGGGGVGLRSAWNRRLLALHVHERGFRIRKPKQDIALRFDEIATMTCTHALRTAQYEVRPTGEWRLRVEPIPEIDCEPVEMWAYFHADDPDLMVFRDTLAEFIANRMWKEMLAAGEVAWTENIWIRPTMLMVRDGRKRDNDGWREVPYHTLNRESWDHKHFTFHQYEKDIQIDLNAPNFHPGVQLVRFLWTLVTRPNAQPVGEVPFQPRLSALPLEVMPFLR